MEAILEARTLKTIFYILLGLVLLANVVTFIVYVTTQLSAILIVMGVFDLFVIAPVTVAFGIYVFLVAEGQKVKSEYLTSDLFRNVKISQK